MKIAIDARMYQESGVGRYIRNLIDQLQQIDQKNKYFLLLLPRDRNISLNENFSKIIADFKWYGITEQIKLPKLLRSVNPDLVHFPHFNVPLLYNGKFVVTIHDLIHQHFAMKRATTLDPLMYRLKQLGYRKVFKKAINESAKILVPSNFVKKGLISDYKINGQKVIVSTEAADDSLLAKEGKLPSGIKKPYIFYVGNANPHKNAEGLIRTFRKLGKKYPNLSLVLSGHDHYFWQRIKANFSDSNIIYTGFIKDIELVALYRNADNWRVNSWGLPKIFRV